MPLPPLEVIISIGQQARKLDEPLTGLDKLVLDMVIDKEEEQEEAAVG